MADGDKVVLLSTGQGTHRRELMGVPGSERRVAFTSMRVFRLASEKSTGYWVLWDWLALWQHIGVMPADARAYFQTGLRR